jgi:FemAB-related protein (PEP-CTERM system-associated)
MTEPYTLRAFDDRAAPRWDALVAKCPEATFFHRAAWRPLIERIFGHRTHYAYVQRGREIVGILPMVEVKSALFGHALISNGFSVCGGPAVTEEIARGMLDEYAADLLKSSGAAYVEYRCPPKPNAAWQTRDNLYASFSGPLPADEGENLKQIPRKQRAVVRKAITSGLTYAIDADTDRFYHLYAVSVRNLGTPVFSRAYFAALLKDFAPDCDVLTVCADGKPVAGVLSFYFGNQVMPFYTGSLPEARRLGANDFMYWQLMRRAAARGCTVFNFGRSKVGTGPYEFKKNWGFAPQPITHQFLLREGAAQPDINPLNPKYQLMIALWKRLPIRLANVIGPPIVRNIA